MPYRNWADTDTLNAADLNAMTADADMNYIVTAEGTTSASYTDLATVGPARTLSLVSGQGFLVLAEARIDLDASGSVGGAFSFAVSGGLTLAASDDVCAELSGTGTGTSVSLLVAYWAVATSTASTTVTMKYKRAGAAGTPAFRRRRLIVKKF